MDDSFIIVIEIKKRTILIVAGTILLIALLIFGGVMLLKGNENGTIFICGKVITDIPIELDPTQQNMIIPFVAVLQELGYEVTQQNENSIIINDEDQQFMLNLEQLTLYEEGGANFDYFTPPPGSYYPWCSRRGNDVILDVTTLNSTFLLMGSDYRIVDIPKLKAAFLY